MIKNFFLDKTKEIEKYHLVNFWFLSFYMLVGSMTIFLHGLAPSYFTNDGTNTIKELYDYVNMVNNKVDKVNKID
jgi:hypothetical protein